jgi:hypothetical protein
MKCIAILPSLDIQLCSEAQELRYFFILARSSCRREGIPRFSAYCVDVHFSLDENLKDLGKLTFSRELAAESEMQAQTMPATQSLQNNSWR